MYLHMNTRAKWNMQRIMQHLDIGSRLTGYLPDLWTKTGLESDCFAYMYEYPYIFLYGRYYTKVT